MAKKTSRKKQAKSTQSGAQAPAPPPTPQITDREVALEKALALSRLLDSKYFQRAFDAVYTNKKKGDFLNVCKDAGAGHEEWLWTTLDQVQPEGRPGGGGTTW